MQDFWQSSGYRTLQRNEHGWLRVSPAYLQLILSRPELAPIAESGPRERALHTALSADPTRAVDAVELAQVEDADARENLRHFLAFRKKLVDAVTLERCYLQLFRQGSIDIPPLFVDLMAQESRKIDIL